MSTDSHEMLTGLLDIYRESEFTDNNSTESLEGKLESIRGIASSILAAASWDTDRDEDQDELEDDSDDSAYSPWAVMMTSIEFGDDIFQPYTSEEEAYEAVKRLTENCKQPDNFPEVERTFRVGRLSEFEG